MNIVTAQYQCDNIKNKTKQKKKLRKWEHIIYDTVCDILYRK